MAASMVLQVVVSPLLGVVFQTLSSMIQKKVGLQLGVGKKMKKLANTLSTILGVLEDAEENQLANKMIGKWLQKLKDAAYDAEDFLDEWAIEAGVGHEQVSRSIVTRLKQKLFCRKTAKKINELLERFDEIAAERSKFHLRNDDVVRKVDLYPNRESSSLITESKMYGRDEDKEFISALLLNNVNSQEDLCVCPIVGMGGLGKTTLAEWVYNDERVKKHFDIRAWVCVSDDFDVKRLTKAILESVSKGASDGISELDVLQRTLQGKLAEKRFLLVLDDVWNEEEDDWKRLQCSLKGGAKGSSVVVTTRLLKVASVTGTCPHHSLKLLSEEDCWLLFKQRAFGAGKEGIPNLMSIGKEIVRKCGGVPLAAKVLGSLMSSKIRESQWMVVRDSEIWTLEESSKNTILPALRLSYTHLSPVLRQCFAYCCIFPKDYEMGKQQVIELWMANGLIPSNNRLDEEVGNEIFDALVHKSFFQVCEEVCQRGKFTMHDLLHDLACSITVNECARYDDQKQIPNFQEGIRYLSFMKSSPIMNRPIEKLVPKLRTFLALGSVYFDFSYFAYIRALSLESRELMTVPDSVGDLKHLRYLNLSYNDRITLLPESICRLRKLQTLRMRYCSGLQNLPKGLRKITSLRHLDIRECWNLLQMPIGIGQLTCLRTLSKFMVGQDDGRHIKELKDLDHLSGEIEISMLENVTNVNEAKEVNLMRKQNLQKLDLSWSDSHGNDREVLESLQPHSNTKELNIGCYQGITFPSCMGVSSSLPNLVQICLWKCDACEQLPSFGKLPLLKLLHLDLMHSVKFLGSNDDIRNGFSSLEQLRLLKMDSLEEWSSSSLVTGDTAASEVEQVILFPSLKILDISYCPMLKRLPFPTSLQGSRLALEILRIRACPALDLSTVKFQLFVALETLEIGELEEWSSSSLVTGEAAAAGSEDEQEILFPSLKSLEIKDSPKMKRLPFPTSSIQGSRLPLEILRIRACPALDWSTVKFQLFVALEELEIGEFPDMASLPDGIQRLSSMLKTLCLVGLSSLVVLPDWIGSLTSLRDISIYGCKNLAELPEGLKHLTNLHELSLSGCHPNLKSRCTKETGEDWHKIAHIPYLNIQK